MSKYESLKRNAVPTAVVLGLGGAVVWGFAVGTLEQAPPPRPSGTTEAAPFAQGTVSPLGTVAPLQGNKTVNGTLDHDTHFYEGPDTHANVVGLWPAHGVRKVGIICVAATGRPVHMEVNQIPAGNKTDSDKWYAVDEPVLGGREREWIPASMAVVGEADTVPTCSPDIASK